MNKTIKVLYEDESLIVVDKPAGILVIPSPKKETKTLTSLVNEQYQKNFQDTKVHSSGLKRIRLHPCHRLDRDTSGVIIFAKGKKHQQLMMQEFHKREVQKRYIAFVRGQISPKKGEIEKAIRDHHRQNVAAKMAVTRYKVTGSKPGFSVVEVWPKTGRTNQIRIHFSDMGHPLLGERVYAFRRDFPVKFRRLALHAKEVVFRHPVSKKQVHVTASLPKDMREFLSRMN
ncbi:MAG: RluA family pseudouridine synthase [Candidatus Omnitrophica bacterium]|nr:RluA family pseudouridine synthase [Candidatus Omnitrophota bacterium]